MRRLNARAGLVEEELAPEERKPPYSYASLIRLAIINAPAQRATLADIYRWIQVRLLPHSPISTAGYR